MSKQTSVSIAHWKLLEFLSIGIERDVSTVGE
jgi:hypothetical protein